MNIMSYYRKIFKSQPARVLGILSGFGPIILYLVGVVLTVITRNYVYVIGFAIISFLFHAVFNKIATYIEKKYNMKNGSQNTNQVLVFSKEKNMEGKYRINDEVFLTDSVTYGSDIVLTNTKKGIRKAIIKNCKIVDFPGLIHEEKWKYLWTSERKLKNRVQYYTIFRGQPDGTIKMIWQIQPDGRYWADEGGFGMENDDEIDLFSFLDDEGQFLQPFQYYEGTIL